MLSGSLIHLVESHEEEITGGIVRSIWHNPELSHLGKLPELELRERCQEILCNLGHWLVHGNEEKLAREYEAIGRLRFEEAIPLHESVRGLSIIRENMIDFVDARGIERDCVALYAEEELHRRVGRFFDLLIVHMVRGYEKAWGYAAHATR